MAKPLRMETSTFSEDSPQFFKIFSPENCSKKLRIPPNFIKNFKNTKHFRSTLRTSDERLWPVDVIKVKNYLFFENGWQEFVQYYSLKEGDFLLFYFNGNAQFDVSIFGLDCCPKKLPTCTASKKIQENIQPPETAINFSYPSFERVMKQSYLRTYLSIPGNFWRENIREDKDMAKLVHSKRSWDVKFHFDDKRITTGWAKFARDNCLKEDFLCKFELISTTDYVFNVTIWKPDCKSKGKSKQI